jgi:hypothetical protein
MTVRTFKQHAQAFGAIPTNITVKLDGQEIFSGPLTTENSPLPTLPDLAFAIPNVAFSWEKDSSFSGTVALEISVEGSPMLIADTLANYRTDSPANADIFEPFYYEQVGENIYSDPFSDEQIDGIPVSRLSDQDLPGQWWWTVMPGSTFTTTVHIEASLPPTPPPA